MSIENPNEYDLHAAALTGMGNFHGDPEVAEDLGIPVSEDTYRSHLDSAGTARELQTDDATQLHDPAEAARKDASDYYGREFRLTGHIAVKPPADRAVFHASATAVRGLIEPTRPGKGR